MKTIKQAVLIIFVLLAVVNVASYFYLGTSQRNVPPQINCPEGILEISASDSEEALLTGLTASDPQDGDLTAHITVAGISKLITNDTAKVTYIVFDSDNNMASCVRRIRYVDYHRPVFEVIEPLVYSTTEEITMLSRLRASDVVEGDISKNIRVSTLEPTKNSEIYYVSVQVSNSLGDTSVVRLPVMTLVSNPLRPEIRLTTPLVYLKQGETFTPSAYLAGVSAFGMKPSIADITIEHEVDTDKPDTYYVTYTFTANGSTGTAILTVVVQ